MDPGRILIKIDGMESAMEKIQDDMGGSKEDGKEEEDNGCQGPDCSGGGTAGMERPSGSDPPWDMRGCCMVTSPSLPCATGSRPANVQSAASNRFASG